MKSRPTTRNAIPAPEGIVSTFVSIYPISHVLMLSGEFCDLGREYTSHSIKVKQRFNKNRTIL
jgi:hypothetical protein